MANQRDETGQRYGKVTVLGKNLWGNLDVRCDCGWGYQRSISQLRNSLKPGAKQEGCSACVPHRGIGKRSLNEKTDRNVGIVASRNSGLTYVEISKKYNVSVERVRQIFFKNRTALSGS